MAASAGSPLAPGPLAFRATSLRYSARRAVLAPDRRASSAALRRDPLTVQNSRRSLGRRLLVCWRARANTRVVEPFAPGLLAFPGGPGAEGVSPRLTAGKRREWDSNPRWTCAHASFQDWCLKPLGHLSDPGVCPHRALTRYCCGIHFRVFRGLATCPWR